MSVVNCLERLEITDVLLAPYTSKLTGDNGYDISSTMDGQRKAVASVAFSPDDVKAQESEHLEEGITKKANLNQERFHRLI